MRKHPKLVYNKSFRVGKTAVSLLPFSRKSKPEFKPVDLKALLGEILPLAEFQRRLQGILGDHEGAIKVHRVVGRGTLYEKIKKYGLMP